jgi:hypothetical protein
MAKPGAIGIERQKMDIRDESRSMGVASVLCGGQRTQTFIDAERPEDTRCDRCGMKLKLSWDLLIEEVSESNH